MEVKLIAIIKKYLNWFCQYELALNKARKRKN